MFSRCIILFAFTCLPLAATDYYVNSNSGDDSRTGNSPEAAWRSLEKVNGAPLQPGDRVLFSRGGTWNGSLVVTARGSAGRPVSFASYGKGSLPRIEAGGVAEDAIVLRNAAHVAVREFELTNTGTNRAPRRGVHIVADNTGTLSNIVVADCFIHDVTGTLKSKDNGGIIFRTRGERVSSRFSGLRIERNIVWHVDRSGIVAQSFHAPRTRWFPSTNVVIRDNWIGDVGGDGITPWATDGCLVEHNIVEGANERAGTYNAGIWPWATDNTVMRLNRASRVKTLLDGQGFDSDYNCHNTVIEYNLSHDNEGGFLLICTPGQRKPAENCGNVGTIARYNISRHDGARAFHVSAAENTLVHDNAIYSAPGSDVQALVLTDWSGWARGLEFRNNLFCSEGVMRYGHQSGRDANGAYKLAAGWGPCRDVRFTGNRYEGKQEFRPDDRESNEKAPKPMTFGDWPGPQFDPHAPETFPAYIKAHRAWMIAVMKRQFGREP